MQPGMPTSTRGRSRQPGRSRLAEEIPQHRLAQLEIGDDPVAQRTDDGDRVGRAAFHLLGQVAHRAAAGEDLAGAVLHRDDRRLVEHQPFADQADQRVGRPQIDGQVATEVIQQVLEHPCSREGQGQRSGPENNEEADQGNLMAHHRHRRAALGLELVRFHVQVEKQIATRTATSAITKRIV